MRKTAATIVLAFGFVLLVSGVAFAVSKDLRPRPGQGLLCPGQDVLKGCEVKRPSN
jgi:hypothetical protein